MTEKSGSLENVATCFGVAILGGVLSCALLMLLGDWLFIQAAFASLVLAVIVGAVLAWLFGSPLPAPNAGATVAAEPVQSAAAPAAAEATPDAVADASVKSTQLPGEQELASRKGEWKYEAGADVEEAQPETLSAARDGKADDLKKLKGVGPKLEQTLNELGFYHFEQIAAWTDAEVAWVDSRLKFKGRIERDGWIEQAKSMASGGDA